MFSKIRPFIFKLDPELAHDLAIKALKTNLIDLKTFLTFHYYVLRSYQTFEKDLEQQSMVYEDCIEKSKNQSNKEILLNPVWHVHNGDIPE